MDLRRDRDRGRNHWLVVSLVLPIGLAACAPAALESQTKSIGIAFDLEATNQSMNEVLSLTAESGQVLVPLHAALEIRSAEKVFYRDRVQNNQEIVLELPIGDVEVRSLFLTERRSSDWKERCSKTEGQANSDGSGDGKEDERLFVAAEKRIFKINASTGVLDVSFGALSEVGERRLVAQWPSLWGASQRVVYSDAITNSVILDPCSGKPFSDGPSSGLIEFFLPRSASEALSEFGGRPLSPALVAEGAAQAPWLAVDTKILALPERYAPQDEKLSSASASPSTAESSNRGTPVPVQVDANSRPAKVLPLIGSLDADGDGVSNANEIATGSNPFRKMQSLSVTLTPASAGWGLDAQMAAGGTEFWSTFREARCRLSVDLSRLTPDELKKLEDHRNQLRLVSGTDPRFVTDLSKPFERPCSDRASFIGLAGNVSLEVSAYDHQGFLAGRARSSLQVSGTALAISVPAWQSFSEDAGPFKIPFRVEGSKLTEACAQRVVASNLSGGLFSSIVVRGNLPACELEITTPANAHGTAKVRLTVSAPSGQAEANTEIEVRAVSDGPMWNGVSPDSEIYVSKNRSVLIPLQSAFDPDVASSGEHLSYKISEPSHGFLSEVPFDASLPGNMLTYTASTNLEGTDLIRYSVCDSSGIAANCTPEQVIEIFVLNATPTSLTLSSDSVRENAAVNTTVGYLNAFDPDLGESLVYSLVDGVDDNGLFVIQDGNRLAVNGAIDFETQDFLSLRIRVTDSSSAFMEQTITLAVEDVNEAHSILPIAPQEVVGSSSLTLDFEVDDPEGVVNCSSAALRVLSGASLLSGTSAASGTYPHCAVTANLENNSFGLARIEVSISDGSGLSATQEFLLAKWSTDAASSRNLVNNNQTKALTEPLSGTMWTALQRDGVIEFRYQIPGETGWSFAGGFPTSSFDFSVELFDDEMVLAWVESPTRSTVQIVKGKIDLMDDGSLVLSFDAPQNAFAPISGARFQAPVMTLDDSDYLWIGAIKNSVSGESVVVAKTTNPLASDISPNFGTPSDLPMGDSLRSLSLLNAGMGKLMLFANGSVLKGRHFDGSAWSDISSTGEEYFASLSDSLPGFRRGFEAGAQVRVLTIFDGSLYAGGELRIDGTWVSNIARWNGASWAAVGFGFDGPVNDLHVGEDGYLYAAGDFRNSGTRATGSVARWNGQSWEPVFDSASFFSSRSVVSLASYLSPSGIVLYAASSFSGGLASSASGLWAMHSGVSSHIISDIVTDGQGNLYIASNLGLSVMQNPTGTAGATTIVSGSAKRLVFDKNSGSKGTVFAAGSLGATPDTLVGFDVNSSTVASASAGLSGTVEFLALDGSGHLIAVSSPSSGSGDVWKRLATGWTKVTTASLNGVPISVADYQPAGLVVALPPANAGSPLLLLDSSTPGLFAGSSAGVSSAGGTTVQVKAVVMNASGSRICMGGRFSKVGVRTVSNVACWSGSAWEDMGVGLTGGDVEDLLITPSGRLFAAGAFTSPVGYVAEYNSSTKTWVGLGNGVNAPVHDLELISEDFNATPSVPRIALGGNFTSIVGGTTVSRVTIWNGSSFEPLYGGPNGVVDALAYDPTGKRLYVGGTFSQIDFLSGQTGFILANNLAYFQLKSTTQSFSDWQALLPSGGNGGGVDGPVFALAHRGDSLYIGGDFSSVGGASTQKLAKWYWPSVEQPVWYPLSTGFDGAVRELKFDGFGNLYALGDFTRSNGGNARGFAVSRLGTWFPAGNGIFKPEALASKSSAHLIAASAGGLFQATPVLAAGLVSHSAVLGVSGSDDVFLLTGLASDGQVILRGSQGSSFNQTSRIAPMPGSQGAQIAAVAEDDGSFHVHYSQADTLFRESFAFDATNGFVSVMDSKVNLGSSPSGLFSLGGFNGFHPMPLLKVDAANAGRVSVAPYWLP